MEEELPLIPDQQISNLREGDIITVFGRVGFSKYPEPQRIQRVGRIKSRFFELDDGSKWRFDGRPYPHELSDHAKHVRKWKKSHEKIMDIRQKRIATWKVIEKIQQKHLEGMTLRELNAILEFAKREIPTLLEDVEDWVYVIIFEKEKPWKQ